MQSSPLAARQGAFGFIGRTVLASVLVAAAALAATPAHAANVNITFGLSAGTYAPTGAACSLSVASGADGVAVLDAAVANGCISSYHKQGPTQFGYFVDCIDEVCGETTTGFFLTYWSMYVDGVVTNYGVSDFRAADGDEVTFAYTTWAPCAGPTGCLP